MLSFVFVNPVQGHEFSVQKLCMHMVHAALYGAGKLERLLERDLKLDKDLQKYPQLITFIEKYRCPAHLELAARQEILLLQAQDFQDIARLSCGLYLKGFEFDRIINAVYLHNVIKKHHLTCCMVPEKYVCKVGDFYKVVCQRLEIQRLLPKSLTLEEVKQLAVIAQETGYGDWHTGNIVRCHGKIAFIDTENLSFRIRAYCGIEVDFPEFTQFFNDLHDDDQYNCKFVFLCGLYACMQSFMKPDAKAWLADYLQTMFKEKKATYFSPVTMLYDTKLVLADIDFNKVTCEYVLYHLQKNPDYCPNIEDEKVLLNNQVIYDLIQKRYESKNIYLVTHQIQEDFFKTDDSNFARA